MYLLKFKEQELPIIIDFAVIKAVCNKLNLKLTAFESEIIDPNNIEVICFEALKRGHKLEGKEFTILESDVTEILCECLPEFLLIHSACVIDVWNPKHQPVKKN